jgi:hypothetical protein
MANETSQVNVNQAGGLGGQAPLVFVIRVHYVYGKDKEMDDTIVMGDTYPFKDLLKKHGFSWAPALHLWLALDKDIAKQIAEELRKAGAEVIEVSRLLPDIKEYGIVKKRVVELIERGVIKEAVEISKELNKMKEYPEHTLLPFELQMRYIAHAILKKYQLNMDFEDVLKKMIEGQIGEEKGWLAKERLQKLAKIYVKSRDLGLTDLPCALISAIHVIYEFDFERKRQVMR